MLKKLTDSTLSTKTICHHCGDHCQNDQLIYDGKHFCCNGCEMVFRLLEDNGMTAYYQYEKNPGINQKKKSNNTFEYLDEEKIKERLLTFNEGSTSRITLVLPQIHCSSCLWLLENINKLDSGITSSRVNFIKKEASLQFDNTKTSLRKVVELLTVIGYEPRLSLKNLNEEKKSSTSDRKLLYQIGLAGFVFGNIMLLSFPEYLGFHQASVKMYVGYINILLAIPVLIYGGKDYLHSAFISIKHKHLNIDVPVAIGMITLFFRSVYEILSQTGEGYLDSLAGFIFFLLIGKWFQSFTYKSLDFERNYESYFPISANVKKGNKWEAQSLQNVQQNDVILIRNQELIPVDGILLNGISQVDYSFVTGESDLIKKETGDQLLAGGKHNGSNIELEVLKSVDQSYLTQLWNEDTFKTQYKSSSVKLIEDISKYFTYIVIAIALATLTYWLWKDQSIAFNAFTAVLIVACPCALALAIPFTYGNILRLLSQRGFYMRNTSTIEDIQDINHIVFDKTGTLTDHTQMQLEYQGPSLEDWQKSFIKSTCQHSSHPISKAISLYFNSNDDIHIENFEDFVGLGIKATYDDHELRLGSANYIFDAPDQVKSKGVFIEIDGKYLGHFKIHQAFRKGISEILVALKNKFHLSVISGDNDREASRFKPLFGENSTILFNQSPKNKLDFIKSHQENGQKVMMVGDGLNDAGALKQSNVGIVISDAANNFSPACDVILSAESFQDLSKFIAYLKIARKIIYGAFGLAFLYNIIGLFFAVTGSLSPVIAAILMPLSSISVIIYGVGLSYIVKKIIFK